MALNGKQDTVDRFQDLEETVTDLAGLLELLDEEEFREGQNELQASLKKAEKGLAALKVENLLSGQYDDNNCYFSIHAGAGGMEATDWASMLQRMYERWFESKPWKVQLLDINQEEGAGIKSASYEVQGPHAFGFCRGEKGVHRLVRISPFDSQNRRHTSFASVDVYPDLEESKEVEINEEDLRIDIYRSSGHGGQGVNTTDSAVRITHLPTGLVVTCQNERSQIQNRAKAMEILKSRLLIIKEEEHKEKIEDIQGKYSQIGWGNQIRSYVFQPYTKVKDHRTGWETGNVDRVMDGDLDACVESYLYWKAKEEEES